MVRGVCMASRCTAVLIAALLSSYWAWFALTSFPWIVPPDNSGAYVTAYQYAALAGALLTAVSCGSIVVATGIRGVPGAVGSRQSCCFRRQRSQVLVCNRRSRRWISRHCGCLPKWSA